LEQRISEGERQSVALVELGLESLHVATGVEVDYLAIVDANTLLPVASVKAGVLIAVAAYVGSTRLIDNFLVA
jgi:pantoate--beta-alanine ligase